LDKEIARYREISEGLRIELEDKTKWAQDLDKEIEKHKEVLDRLKGLMKRKEEEVSMLNEVVGGRDRKIEELNTYLRFRDSEVLALRSSYSFRIGRLFVLPVSSVMEFFKKTWVGLMVSLNFFRHPINFIKKLSFDNVRRFFSALKTESRVSVLGNVKRFLAKNGRNFLFDSAELQLFPVQNYNKKIVFEKVDSPVVSIIIPVYNQWDYTYSCLLSILENTKGIDYEVIIADDVSLDETKNINKYVKNVVVVRNEINLGFLRNCKNSARHAKGQYLIFLNNDTNAQGGWLRSLLDVFESDDRVGLVGSKLVYPNGKLQEAGGIIWKNGTGWNYGKTQDPSMPEFNYVKEVDYISGASIMIKTDLWKEIGGFDERYERAYFEDGDLAFEVRKHGYKVIYQPKSVVVHFEGVSCGTSEQSGEKSYQKKNRETFVNKWKDVLEKDNFNPGENVFLARDKSGHKKTILVIDHYVPHFDKDAGSKTMFQYLKLFAEMGMNVKFMGDNFYKHEPYTSILQQAGVEVLYGNWFAKEWRNWLKENGHCFDYVYLNRSSVSVKYIDFVKEFTGAKIIYNAVDFSYLRLQRQYELTGDESLKSAVKEAKKQEYYIFERSDIIITISDFEKKLLERDFDGKSVYVIPTYIYDDVFLNQDFPGYDERRDILFVGGFAHGPNVDAISWFVKEIFSNIEKDLPGVKLNIIGSNPPEEVLRLKSGKINILGFVPEEELKKYYLNSKLILAPLRFGAGVKGKIIEAISYNVPVITTSIGAEGIERGNEFLVVGNNANTFAKNIIAVYKDERKWHKINVSEKKYAREYLSKDRAGKIFSKIFNL
ncbi:glycosyltransferase, partial [Candidatus Peregrinibacteria bacterium]|nr:glycosyltransferase [Candidatus Peregrinibacteria bacterium]